MKNRRSLTPSEIPDDVDGVHATRRSGARHEVSARVTLKPAAGVELAGWALNISRGGLRVILEEKVDLGAQYEVRMHGPADPLDGPRLARIVWVQEEPDGVVAGIEFRDSDLLLVTRS